MSRETPERLHLTPDEGVPGDAWGRNPERKLEAQIAVMQRDIADLIANGQPLTLFGDSLFVDFNLSTANLPIGSRLRVGEAVVEVTPMPHNGCSKFKARFGADALFFVNAKPTRHLNLRGDLLEGRGVWRGSRRGADRSHLASLSKRKPGLDPASDRRLKTTKAASRAAFA